MVVVDGLVVNDRRPWLIPLKFSVSIYFTSCGRISSFPRYCDGWRCDHTACSHTSFRVRYGYARVNNRRCPVNEVIHSVLKLTGQFRRSHTNVASSIMPNVPKLQSAHNHVSGCVNATTNLPSICSLVLSDESILHFNLAEHTRTVAKRRTRRRRQ